MIYRLQYGNRRFQAIKKLGWNTIEAKDLSDGTFKTIRLKDIKESENIRTNLDDLGELMQSIKQKGLLEPVGVVPERDFVEEEHLVVNATENIQRKEISPAELGKLCLKLQKKGLTRKEIASRLSIPLGRIESALNLVRKVPKEYLDDVGFIPSTDFKSKKSGKVSSSVMTSILNISTTKPKINKVIGLAKKHNLTRDNISVMRTLVEMGFNPDKALKEIKKYDVVRVSIVVLRKEIDKSVKKYKTSKSMIVSLMLIGKIPLNRKMFQTNI